MIEVHAAVRHFGDMHAVDGVDLAVGEGEFFGLIGHNGAGKTTLFRLMLGLLSATAGEIRIAGESVRGRGFRQVRRKIGYLPESAALYDHLSGLETMRFFARLKAADPATCALLLERVGLSHAADRSVGKYSKGMRQRLILAQALLGNPRLLFLDEPTNGLDPAAVQDCYALLGELRQQGVTIVLTSHILAEIQQRVDRLALMSGGKVQALGTVAALRGALDLPVEIRVTFGAGQEAALRDALRQAGVSEVALYGATASVRCARERKMAVLVSLAALSGVSDIEILEPSLEDVFMGYARKAA